MGILEAIILGVIQGLTEFLPVSSSGHLELANAVFGIKESDNLAFAVAVHGATVLSTIVVLWHEIADIFRGLFRFRMNDQTRMAINIVISMIPVVIVGLFFKDKIEALYTSNLKLVGSMLLITALLLALSQFLPRRDKPITPMTALLMGIAQAVAVLPGLSRSGSTISTGLMAGSKPGEVAKFSFLMVLVPIIGMNMLDLMKGSFTSSEHIASANILAGAIAAFITGTIACKWMIGIVKRGKLIWFAVYCLVVGIAALIFGMLHP